MQTVASINEFFIITIRLLTFNLLTSRQKRREL